MGDSTKVFLNPLTAQLHEYQKSRILETFPILKKSHNKSYLLLWKYIEGSPERFYSEVACNSLLQFYRDNLKNNSKELIQLLNNHCVNFTIAFKALDEINRMGWHDEPFSSDEHETMKEIEFTINPIYLKLIEAVYSNFIYPIAVSKRLGRGKSLDGLDIYNCVEELSRSNFDHLCFPYDNTIRNSIAHGTVTYKHHDICFKDKKRSRTVSTSAFLNLCDELIDMCNGLCLATKLFYLGGFSKGLVNPRYLMVEELKAETNTPWWQIEGCLDSEYASGSQLVIFARPKTRDYNKVYFSTFLSGILSEHFAPGYDRYFFSLRTPLAWSGWAAFDGKKLKKIREQNSINQEDYRDVLENKMVFYVPYIKLPKIFNKIGSLYYSYLVNLSLSRKEFKKKNNLIDFTTREVSIHRNGWRSVVNGSIVLNIEDSKDVQEIIRSSCSRLIRGAIWTARKSTQLRNIAKILPVGFIRIKVFSKDYRARRLKNFGLEYHCIGTIELKSIKRIQMPDIYGGKLETKGRYRIVWNKKWLEKSSKV